MFPDLFINTPKTDNRTRQQKQMGKIVRYLSTSGKPKTIPQITRHLRLSVPTATNLIQELIQEEWVVEAGKKETDNGRKPSLYSLNLTKYFMAGMEIGLKTLRVVVTRLDCSAVYEGELKSFELENTPECLEIVLDFLINSLEASGIPKTKLIGLGVGITGRVNRNSGASLNYFNFMEQPLQAYLQQRIGLMVYIENDTRVNGIAEQVLGNAREIDHALIVNVGRGLGLSVIINRNIHTGASGYAGEYGHMQLGQSDRLCICGKKGCLETEVSGAALEADLLQALEARQTSLHFDLQSATSKSYRDVILASLQGDALSIDLLQKQGQKLGQALGSIINLLNPERIVIGGEFARNNEFFIDAIALGLKKTALLPPLSQCELIPSALGEDSAALGAAALVLRKFEMI